MTTNVQEASTSAPPPVAQSEVASRLEPLLRPSYVVACTVATLAAKLLWFDHQVSADAALTLGTRANVATVLLLVSWLPLVRPAKRLFSALVLDVAVSALILADLLYVRYFDALITVPVITQAAQVGAVSGSVTALIEPADALLFADLPVVALAWWLVRRVGKQRSGSERHAAALDTTTRRHRVAVTLCLLIGGIVLAGEQSTMLRNPDVQEVMEKRLADAPVYRVVGLLGFHLYDTFQFAVDHLGDRELSTKQLARVQARFDSSRETPTRQPVGGAPGFGEYRGSNVLMVQVEALQSFVIGREIEGTPITPNLDRLLRSSARFPNSYHETADGRTSDAEFLTGCSLYPASSGSVFVRFPSNDYDCLPRILQRRGYSTAAHHAYSGAFWNRDNMYPTMGYQRFYTRDDYSFGDQLGWGLGDRPFLTATVRQMQEQRRPSFNMAVTLTSHHPFNVANLPTHIDLGPLRGTPLGDYVQTVHYTDSAIGAMVAAMKRAGLWDKTVVVLYGDHDNGIAYGPSYERLLGHSLDGYEQARLQRGVPVLMHFPDGAHAVEFADPVGQIDVAPTLLHVLGVPLQERYLFGHNAFSPLEHRVVFADGGFADHDLFFVPGQAGVVDSGHCYDRRTGHAVDTRRCAPGAAASVADLTASELVHAGDAIRTLQERQRPASR